MARIVCIGEAMLELSGSPGAWRLGYGGDTLNTAIHLARAGHDVAYLTGLGADPFSADLRRQWRAEGLDTSLILTDPVRHPGLYAITTDAAGERTFTYWRQDSAVRHLFALDGIEAALAAVERADLLAYSLITLAVLPLETHARLFQLCRAVRARGGRVAFDANYRPRLWDDPARARQRRDTAIACADIGLPTLDDEAELSCDGDADAVAARWQSLGCRETLVKIGPDGCRLPDGVVLTPPERLDPVDTSGAGDAFNGGYLAARMNGASIEDAARSGHRLAAWCIMRRGAIPARDS
jgi:2-dehydro-3-deoxygluconokinase